MSILESKRNPKGIQRFTKNKKQKRIVLGSIVGIILIIGCITLYKTFALYKEERTFDVLEGFVSDFESDIKLAIKINGEKKDEIPTKGSGNYKVDVSCDNGAIGKWNYTEWNVVVSNFKAGTKCNIEFTTSTEEVNDNINKKIKQSSKTQSIKAYNTSYAHGANAAHQTVTFDFHDLKDYKNLSTNNFAISITGSSNFIQKNTTANEQLGINVGSKVYDSSTGQLTVYYSYNSNNVTFYDDNFFITATCFYIET